MSCCKIKCTFVFTYLNLKSIIQLRKNKLHVLFKLFRRNRRYLDTNLCNVFEAREWQKIAQLCIFKKIIQPRSNELINTTTIYELCGASYLGPTIKHKFNLLPSSTVQTRYPLVLLHSRYYVTEYFLRQTGFVAYTGHIFAYSYLKFTLYTDCFCPEAKFMNVQFR